MSQCKWCDKKGFFLSLNKKGLCKSCRSIIENEINKNIREIRHSIRVAGNSENKEIIKKHCVSIVNKAHELQKYEKKGLPTINPLPSVLIKEYTTLHDKQIIDYIPEKVNEALSDAEKALSPIREIYGVKVALGNIDSVKSYLASKLSPQIIALINHKGGVGKTTSTINLGAALAELNKTVLLIDFDPQANLTDGMGIEEKELKVSIYNILKGEVICEDGIIKKNEKLSVIPSNIFLTKAEKEFSRDTSNIYLLRNSLKILRGFDYVLIDCPPSLGILTLNALGAAQELIIPLQPEYYALKGIRKLFDVIDFVKRKMNRSLTIKGIIGTRYDSRKVLHREVLSKIRESLGNNIFYTGIRENIALAEASSFGKTIFEYKPKCHGAEDYMNLCKELLEKNTNHRQQYS
jgi:chromosome partitioning protein